VTIGKSSTTTISVRKFHWQRALAKTDIRPVGRKLVAWTLAHHASADGTNAHPGVARLAVECGISERAVMGHLAALRDAGLIVRTSLASTKGRKGMADCYDLTRPASATNQMKQGSRESDTNQVNCGEPGEAGFTTPGKRSPGKRIPN
jgi:hypothetical protein